MSLFVITPKLSIPLDEVEFFAIRAQGAGGQNVNKVATALHCRLNIPASSLPDEVKERLLVLNDSRITDDGVLNLKAQRFRTQAKNRSDALERIRALIAPLTKTPKRRIKTKPSRASKERRLKSKNRRSQVKKNRQNPRTQD